MPPGPSPNPQPTWMPWPGWRCFVGTLWTRGTKKTTRCSSIHAIQVIESTTDTATRCPYKGVASYWSVRAGGTVHKDLAWSFRAPIPECPKIDNLICFYNELVDLEVDGEPLERPRTPWSVDQKR
ncbi:MAG: DUF427 domain-containing protein [Chloroflexi bacterium]|nr:MAG: DUF427 domain-containing protein [Chloroflexota bacterium]